ncbi:HEAT repeat domain-containing protein [Floridanema aerugineum]|uniref:HEAT repeat domain-containing protein n=1 Tax=Floridaenema aerugineum BLCC-F46 TaxID=3153654 RepID=A0ABV4X9M7_9CYAN
MMRSSQSRSIQANSLGLQKLKQTRASQRCDDGKRLTYERLAEKAGVSDATVKRFFGGKAVDIPFAEWITQALGLKLADVVDADELELQDTSSASTSKVVIEREICQALIAEKRRLTTNPLTTGDGTRFQYKDVYVPLGLVERKRQPKRDRQDSPKDGSKLYQPTEYEETRKFENNEFFEKVLAKGDSPKSQGKRLAIIGEPGAGKTTLLQQIADWVFDSTEDEVAILVSLAELDKRSLEDYLLNDWLKNAFREVEVTLEMKKALAELFNSRRVWLLLDGIDEMGVLNPLGAIASQLRGFLASARVVLTCRLNVWDAGKNALDNFDIYRNLDFSEVQMGEFISRWFASCSELGEQLQMELSKPGKERIQDLVKNPLRLTLLCHFWQKRQGKLPSTKAGLYQRFVEVFYEWKQEYFPTTFKQRQELNQALGELAKQAISQPSSRFRLTRSLVFSVLGEYDESLSNLAINLGWLNRVGVAKENPDEPVYAFYHPTFQEYFAALAINDWLYLFNHVPENPERGTYRIFEPQWKEVILLWLGREDLEKEQKEAFIRALVSFEDDCESFYQYQAYFLSAAGIAEFKGCSIADEIVSNIVRWCFGYFDDEKQEWIEYLFPIEEGAKLALLETDRSRVITALLELLQTAEAVDIYWQVSQTLVQIGMGSQQVITNLKKLIETTKNEEFCLTLAETLAQIDPENHILIDTLRRLIQKTRNREIMIDAARILGEIGTGIEEVIELLVEFIHIYIDDYIDDIPFSISSLHQMSKQSDKVVIELERLIQSSNDESTRMQAIEILEEIAPDNKTMIAALVQLTYRAIDEKMRVQAAKSLGKINPCHPRAIVTLVQLMQMAKDEQVRLEAAKNLGKIGKHNQTIISLLAWLIQSSQKKFIRKLAVIGLGEIGIGNEKAIAALIKLIHTDEDEYICIEASKILAIIEPNNETAITSFFCLIQTTKDKKLFVEAANNIGEVYIGNEKAIINLIKAIHASEDAFNRMILALTLNNIDRGNEEAITALVDIIHTTNDVFIRIKAIEYLGIIAEGNEKAISALVNLIHTTENESLLYRAASSLRLIDPSNEIVINTLIKLLNTKKRRTYLSPREFRWKYRPKNIRGETVFKLIDNLDNEIYKKDFERFSLSYEVMWHCAQNRPYLDFYKAWQNQLTTHPEILETSTTHNLFITQNLIVNLPQILRATIQTEPILNQNTQLICIDTSKFIDPNNPSAKIYTEMVKQDCPKCSDGTPKTLPELQAYWDLLMLESEKFLILIFYETLTVQPGQGMSEIFLNALSKFEGAIALISTQTNHSLQTFSPNQPKLIENILGWMRAITLEN